MTKIYFRHDNYREEQNTLVKDIAKVLQENKTGLFEAPTGLGKTDAALATAISYTEKKTIFFVTPKTSQHKIALDVVKGLNRKYSLDLKAVNILGKQKMCSEIPLMNNARGFYEFCESKIRSNNCPAYKNFKNKSYNKNIFLENELSAEDILEFGIGNKVCPYELAIELSKKANIIICDYNYLFNSKIREAFFQKTGKELGDSIIIVDEAHNLADRIRSNSFYVLNKKMILQAIKEADSIDNKEFWELSDKLRKVSELFKEKYKDKEFLVDKDLFKDILLKFEELPDLETEHLKEIAKKTKSGELILPYVYSFFSNWFENHKSIIRFFKTENEKDYNLVLKYLDPSFVTKTVFENANSAILMSGTLSPFKMYVDILGLPKDTLCFKYNSPFPKENKLVMYDDSFSTKYELRNSHDLEEISSKIATIINNISGNVAVFLPSHRQASEFYNSLTRKTAKKIYLQDKNAQKSKKIVEDFKKSRGLGSVLVGVLGGSFSEGLDFPGEELVGVFILGIPFPEPTLEIKELIKYYDERFANGWNYGYTYPTISKVVQATGRVIRTYTDRGFVVLIDQRYTWKKYSNLLPDDLRPNTLMSSKLIESFFNN